MADWWESAPIVESPSENKTEGDPAQGDWWSSAPIVERKAVSDTPPAENEEGGLLDLASIYGASVLAAATGGGIGGPTARRAIGENVPTILANLPGMLAESAADAVTAPGRAMSGELQVMGPDGNVSPEAIAEGVNFAGFASPATIGGRVPGMVAEKAARLKPEGLQVAESAQRLGVDLPLAAVSDNAAIQQAGKTLTSVPIGGTPLRKASEKAIAQLDDAATRVEQELGSGNIANAGAAAREGMTEYSKGVLKDAVSKKYDVVDDLVSPNVLTPLQKTANVAADIAAKRANANIAGNSQAVSLVQKALNAEKGMNYEGIKDLRTSIGELLDNPGQLVSGDVSERELKRIYDALTADLKTAVGRSGGDKAIRAFEDANSFAAKTAVEREALNRIVGKNSSDEQIFSKIEAMAGSTARADQVNLSRVRRAVSDETWNEISSAVVSKLGRGPDGAFSPDRFLSSYGKLSDKGKEVLFKSNGKTDLSSALDDIASVSRRFKRLNQFANPSGTAQNVISGAAGFALLAEPITTVSSVAGARVMANILSKPIAAKKLANWAKAYEAAAAKPGSETEALLTSRARVLSLEIAKEAGNARAAGDILPSISRVRQLPAEQGSGDNRVPESENENPENQPRMLAPNEA